MIYENDIVDELVRIRSQHPKYIQCSFESIVGNGPNSSIIHYNSKK